MPWQRAHFRGLASKQSSAPYFRLSGCLMTKIVNNMTKNLSTNEEPVSNRQVVKDV